MIKKYHKEIVNGNIETKVEVIVGDYMIKVNTSTKLYDITCGQARFQFSNADGSDITGNVELPKNVTDMMEKVQRLIGDEDIRISKLTE